jgi:hypothetical protein
VIAAAPVAGRRSPVAGRRSPRRMIASWGRIAESSSAFRPEAAIFTDLADRRAAAVAWRR